MQQMNILTAPGTNEEGFAKGYKQLLQFVAEGAQAPAGLKVGYDRDSDTYSVDLRPGRPSTSYFCPGDPRILLRLDVVSGELTALELTHFRSTLAKEHPALKALLRSGWLQRLLHRNAPSANPFRELGAVFACAQPA